MNLSVIIITKNSADRISKCLSSVKDLSDDIVVVIDDSTVDKTESVVKQFGARYIRRKFTNFADQKNFAISACKNDWILSLDDDEYLTSQLCHEIVSVLPTTSCVAFKIPRLNYIFARPIYHSGWSPKNDSHVWLFRKSKSKWVGDVHEEVIFEGKVGTLKNYKIHNAYSTVEQFVSKLNQYTSLETKNQNPFGEFIKRYIWHRGFLDGWHGLFLSYLMFIYRLTTWVKIWEKKNIS